MTTLRNRLKVHSIGVRYNEFREGYWWLWLMKETKRLDLVKKAAAKHDLRYVEHGYDALRGHYVKFEAIQLSEAAAD
jgi:hypothetical protein